MSCCTMGSAADLTDAKCWMVTGCEVIASANHL